MPRVCMIIWLILLVRVISVQRENVTIQLEVGRRACSRKKTLSVLLVYEKLNVLRIFSMKKKVSLKAKSRL